VTKEIARRLPESSWAYCRLARVFWALQYELALEVAKVACAELAADALDRGPHLRLVRTCEWHQAPRLDHTLSHSLVTPYTFLCSTSVDHHRGTFIGVGRQKLSG
jgi:hypothetical protein